jgi:hypothetical protein
MRVNFGILIAATLVIAPAGIVFANGGGSMAGGMSTGSADGFRPSSPEELARNAYNSGVRSIKDARGYESDAAKASKPEKSSKGDCHVRAQPDLRSLAVRSLCIRR